LQQADWGRDAPGHATNPPQCFDSHAAVFSCNIQTQQISAAMLSSEHSADDDSVEPNLFTLTINPPPVLSRQAGLAKNFFEIFSYAAQQ
jgi:hypothetical protein